MFQTFIDLISTLPVLSETTEYYEIVDKYTMKILGKEKFSSF